MAHSSAMWSPCLWLAFQTVAQAPPTLLGQTEKLHKGALRLHAFFGVIARVISGTATVHGCAPTVCKESSCHPSQLSKQFSKPSAARIENRSVRQIVTRVHHRIL